MDNFYGTLNESNLDRVAQSVRERLEGKRFSIAAAMRADSPDTDLELTTGCELNSSWTDGKPGMVRVFRDESDHWFGFSAGGYFWTFTAAKNDLRDDPNREYARFSFDRDGFRFEQRAPCGDLHKHVFRVE